MYPTPSSADEKRSPVVPILLLIVLAAALFLLWNSGLLNVLPKPFVKNAGNVNYFDLYKYDGQRVTVEGNLVLPKIQNICGGKNWARCKIWLDDDPKKPGLGLHEVYLNVGNKPNGINDTTLLDDKGKAIAMQKSDSMDWAKVKITGIVDGCKEKSCVINAEKVVPTP